MIVYEVTMTQDARRIRHGWVKTLDEATTYMDTFLAGISSDSSFGLDVVRHKAKSSKTEAMLAILNGDTEQTLMYTASVLNGKTHGMWRKNRKILNPIKVAYEGVQGVDNHPSPEHASAVAHIMAYPDLLALCVKAPNVSAWQETTRRLSLRQGALATRRMRSYVWHWFHVHDKLSP
jgi:hypothetical protein